MGDERYMAGRKVISPLTRMVREMKAGYLPGMTESSFLSSDAPAPFRDFSLSLSDARNKLINTISDCAGLLGIKVYCYPSEDGAIAAVPMPSGFLKFVSFSMWDKYFDITKMLATVAGIDLPKNTDNFASPEKVASIFEPLDDRNVKTIPNPEAAEFSHTLENGVTLLFMSNGDVKWHR